MKVIGDIKDATRKGMVDREDLRRIHKKLNDKNQPVKPPEDNSSKLISEAISILKKAVDDNNALMKANILVIESVNKTISDLKNYLDKNKPESWHKIDVDVKRDRTGKIESVEMKRRE